MTPTTHGGAAVKRVDTHAGVVFLAGERALKLKRAVQFPFLDFSSLEKRRAACEAEIEVNRPYAPELYRGVVAITREADGRLAIGGTLRRHQDSPRDRRDDGPLGWSRRSRRGQRGR